MALSDSFNFDDWLVVGGPLDQIGAPVLVVLNGDEHDQSGKAGLPMKSRHVDAILNVKAGIAETCETLVFSSNKDCSATFRFPLPPKSAVKRVTAIIGSKTITTETKKKAQAERDFREATQQGHTAVKVSQQSAQNIFELALGNLGANESAVIKIEYLQLLPKIGQLLEYTHTATWVPPYRQSSYGAPGAASPAQASKVSYSLTHAITVLGDPEMTVSAIDSPTHDIQIHSAQPGTFKCRTSDEVSDASKDFQLVIELHAKPASNIQLQTTKDAKSGEETSTLLAVFHPKGSAAVGLKQEVLLVIDCSGSMQGEPAQQAKEAAMFFVRDLPAGEGVCFNVVCFGSSYVKMWNGYREYNEETEAEALHWLDLHVNANLGGTEMLAVMSHVYFQSIQRGWERQVLLLTDGGVGYGQDQQLIDLVDSKGRHPSAARSHVFPLGIGHGVHRPLLDAVAEKSNGAARYVVDSSEIAKKMGWLSNAVRAKDRVHNLKLITRGCVLRTTPKRLPTILWPGQPLTILATIMKAQPEAAIELIGEDADGMATSIRLAIPQQPTSEGTAFKTLHAMSTISDLTSQKPSQKPQQPSLFAPAYGWFGNMPEPVDDETKEEIVRLACAEGLVTEYTTSVGVEARQDPLDPTKVTHHDIPVQVPANRQGSSYQDSQTGVVHKGFGSGVARSIFCCSTVPGAAQPQAFSFGGPAPGAASPSLFGDPAPGAASPSLFGSPVPATGAPSPTQGLFGASAGSPTLFGSASGAPQGGSANPFSGGFGSAAPQEGISEASFGGSSKASFGGGFSFAPQSARGTPSNAFFGRSEFESAAPQGDAASNEEDADVCMEEWNSNAPTQTTNPKGGDVPKGSTKVQQLSNLRETQGYWKATASLFAILFGDHADWQAHFEEYEPAPGGFSHDVKATVLALAWLMKRQRNEQAVWQGLWDKAIRWLQGNGGAAFTGGRAAAEKVVAAARNFV